MLGDHIKQQNCQLKVKKKKKKVKTVTASKLHKGGLFTEQAQARQSATSLGLSWETLHGGSNPSLLSACPRMPDRHWWWGYKHTNRTSSWARGLSQTHSWGKEREYPALARALAPQLGQDASQPRKASQSGPQQCGQKTCNHWEIQCQRRQAGTCPLLWISSIKLARWC